MVLFVLMKELHIWEGRKHISQAVQAFLDIEARFAQKLLYMIV